MHFHSARCRHAYGAHVAQLYTDRQTETQREKEMRNVISYLILQRIPGCSQRSISANQNVPISIERDKMIATFPSQYVYSSAENVGGF